MTQHPKQPPSLETSKSDLAESLDIDSFAKATLQELLQGASIEGKGAIDSLDGAIIVAADADVDVVSVKSDDEASTDEDDDAYQARIVTGQDLRGKLRIKKRQKRSVRRRTA